MEGDAGTSQLNPTDDDGLTEESDEVTDEASAAADQAVDETRRSRLGRGWFTGICAALTVLTVGVAVAGYLALRSHDASEAIARSDAAALAAAKDCVSATHAPDAAAMSASQLKIIDCATGDFAAQATLYSGVLIDAYEAASVTVKVSDLRAAVERHNDDGSIDVLVAVRTTMSNSQVQNQEQGYRLRVKMAPADGQFKVARLDQVSA